MAIGACEKGADCVLPFEFLKELRYLDLNLDVISYSVAIGGCEKGADWVLPFEL